MFGLLAALSWRVAAGEEGDIASYGYVESLVYGVCWISYTDVRACRREVRQDAAVDDRHDKPDGR
jgi:hypothetical protein